MWRVVAELDTGGRDIVGGVDRDCHFAGEGRVLVAREYLVVEDGSRCNLSYGDILQGGSQGSFAETVERSFIIDTEVFDLAVDGRGYGADGLLGDAILVYL